VGWGVGVSSLLRGYVLKQCVFLKQGQRGSHNDAHSVPDQLMPVLMCVMSQCTSCSCACCCNCCLCCCRSCCCCVHAPQEYLLTPPDQLMHVLMGVIKAHMAAEPGAFKVGGWVWTLNGIENC
jgi:hypothetical protein